MENLLLFGFMTLYMYWHRKSFNLGMYGNKDSLNLHFLLSKRCDITRLFKQHQLWYHIWDELGNATDAELHYFLNLIYPTVNDQKSKLFDCSDDNYKGFHSQKSEKEAIYPDESYYRWASSHLTQNMNKQSNHQSLNQNGTPNSHNQGLFNDFFNIGSLNNHSNVLPKTIEFQKKLFKHQNPMTCEGKRFIELPINDWGLGSVLIHLSRKFIMAMNHGYIPIMPRKKWVWASGTHFCGKDNSFTCFFEEISNCTNYYYANYSSKNTMAYLDKLPPPFHFPVWIEEFLSDTPIFNSLETNLYYSEAQVLAYLMRPKQKLIQWMDDYIKKDPLPSKKIDVSMHIRHGDKGIEMKLIPTMEYMNAAKIIQRLEKKKNLTIFISTEDQNAIYQLRNSTNDVHVLAFNHERTNGGYHAFKKDATNVALISFLNLRECLRSKYFVGTVRSCWSFVTNALRISVGFHFNEIYFEVGQETCLSVCHCKKIGRPRNRPYTWGIW
ncbi:hypothetical protein TRFO_14713 [Tritrichomonas foetus]|uniref:Alpha-(1,6)-fucosyltransferase N- and catalytic domain-containing protein n=1 Tax=Tritrichomonas foetus TaxID=1144522 RepID=A0A1J4KUW7_9EUKA|nr:hypothetical protein TRFO_14713 [Tritrichomonas foetus]|eukprot:OHT14914.1 hypothetical protein TRFO_14713 [Tritrichomonas foetus]